jgi:eukaryotic-like serine/threonine-protein kinase
MSSVDESADHKTTPVEESAPNTLPDLPLPVQPGELFLGKYRIERVLGRGGMGVVMAAHHEGLDERVAIKFLGAAGVGKKLALSRFEREARAAAKLKNEHVARVLDVGQFGEGAAYMVVEYLAGHDLGVELDDKGTLEVADAVDYVLQAIDAVADAHARGIVHRDLKPSNLFLSRRSNGAPLIKVLDFGIAKSDTSDGSGDGGSLTATNAIMGSPRYMSPEQIRSTKTVDHRSDIWSLGVVLYELLTGAAPFSGDSSTELFAAVLMDTPRSLRELRADLPEGLEKVVRRCLARDRNERYPSVAALANDLAAFAPPRSRALLDRFSRDAGAEATLLAAATPDPNESASKRASTTGGEPRAVAQTDTSWTPLEPIVRRGPVAVGAVGFLFVLAFGAAAWAFWLGPKLAGEARLEAEAVPSVAAAPAPTTSALPSAVSAAVTPAVSVAPPEPSAPPVVSAPAPGTAQRRPRPVRPTIAPPGASQKPRRSVLEARE